MPSSQDLLKWCDRYVEEFAAAGLPPPQLVLMHRMTTDKRGKARKVPAINWKAEPDCTAATRQKLLEPGTYGGLSLRTGRQGGVWVVDVDKADNGLQAWEALASKHEPIATWVQDTPNDGFHLFFRYEDKYDCLSIDAKLDGKGIDYRCNDGIIMVHPSFNSVVGKAYAWRAMDTLAACPDWLGDYCIQNRTAKQKQGKKCTNSDAGSSESAPDPDGKHARRNDDDYWGHSKYPIDL